MSKHKRKGRRKYISDADIISDLQAVAKNMGKKSLTTRDYCRENGAKYCYETMKIRFGSWDTILTKAELELRTCNKKKISDAELINDLQAVAKKMRKKTLKVEDYCKENGAKYIYQTVRMRFKNWNEALKAAGLETKTGYKKHITDIDFIKNLQYVAKNIKKNTLKGKDYCKRNGAKYNYQTVVSRFGSWYIALEKSGLEVRRKNQIVPITSETLLADVARVSKELKMPNLLITEYEKYGNFSTALIREKFGKWNNIKIKAGLKPFPITEDYMQNLFDIWVRYGRKPRGREMVKPFSIGSYVRKFGSWKNALKTFQEYVNHENNNDVDDHGNISLRLQFMALKRDNFSCNKCGCISTEVPLVVKHIIPIDKGGKTGIENLETICNRCIEQQNNRRNIRNQQQDFR